MPYIDLHCDRLSSHANAPVCTLEALEAGECAAQFFAVFVNTKAAADPLAEALAQLERFYRMLEAAPHRIALAKDASSLRRNRESGKLSALLSLEDAGVCAGNAEALRLFIRMGVRMLSLTWNHANVLARPNDTAGGKADRSPSLGEAGISALRIAEEAGVLIDVSHLSDGGVYEVLAHTKAPIVASHSNARTVCPNVRNLTDDMIDKIARRGGVIGLNFYPLFLLGREFSPPADQAEAEHVSEAGIAAICRHACHIAKVGGAGCLAIGSDYDGFESPAALPSPAAMPKLAAALRECGFSKQETEGILCENFLRVFRMVTG